MRAQLLTATSIMVLLAACQASPSQNGPNFGPSPATYRTDQYGNRIDAQGYRVDAQGYRIDANGYRVGSQPSNVAPGPYRTDQYGDRIDAQGYRVDANGYRLGSQPSYVAPDPIAPTSMATGSTPRAIASTPTAIASRRNPRTWHPVPRRQRASRCSATNTASVTMRRATGSTAAAES